MDRIFVITITTVVISASIRTPLVIVMFWNRGAKLYFMWYTRRSWAMRIAVARGNVGSGE